MTKKKTDTNVTKTSKLIPVRWPFEILDGSRECAAFRGEVWSDFVKTAVKERIEKVKKEMELENK